MVENHPYLLLGEGDANASLLQGGLDPLDQAGPGLEIILGLYPDPAGQVDATLGELDDQDGRGGLLKRQGLGLHHRGQHLLGPPQVVLVADADGQIHPPGGMGAGVGDDTVDNAAVGHDDLLVIHRGQFGVEQGDLPHLARDPGGGDEIADLEGPEKHQHGPGGQVAQGVLEGQAHRQAGGADHGQEGGGIHPQLTQAGDHHHDEQGIEDHRPQELDQGGLHPVALQQPGHDPDDPVGEPTAGEKDDHRRRHLGQVGGEQEGEGFQMFVHSASWLRVEG